MKSCGAAELCWPAHLDVWCLQGFKVAAVCFFVLLQLNVWSSLCGMMSDMIYRKSEQWKQLFNVNSDQWAWFMTSLLVWKPIRVQSVWRGIFNPWSVGRCLWKLASDFVCSETSWWHSDIVLFDVRQRVRSVLSYSSSVVLVHQLFWLEPPAVSRCRGNYFPLPPTYIPAPGLKTSSSPLHMSVTSLSSASYA